MKHVKILHILEASLGGTGRHVCDLLRCLEGDQQFRVTLVYSALRADTRFLSEIARLSRGTTRLIEISMAREVAPVRDLVALRKLCRLIRQERFDIVHAHSSKAGALGRLAARLSLRKVATVYTPHAIAIRMGYRYWVIEKLLGYLSDRLIAVSASERSELVGYGIVPDSKIRTASLGIDALPFRGGRCYVASGRKSECSDSPLIVGTVARLCEQKDPITFVRTAELVARELPGVQFVWVGDGELRDVVAAEVKRRNLRSVVSLLPFDPEISPVMRSFDVFFLPSRYESFGYVTCEAMAAGLPIVATDVSGSKDLVIEGVVGYLVPPGDPRSAARALMSLLGDRALRVRMGQAALRRVEEYFGIEVMANGVREMYSQLLQERKWSGSSTREEGAAT
jgi:glycosyltransferase involved in cell wall biosynthesis